MATPFPVCISDAVVRTKVHAPAANTAATKTITVQTNEFAVIWRIQYSYSGSGTLVTTDANVLTTTGLLGDELEIAHQELAPFELNGPYYGTVGTNVVVTLGAGGTSVDGKIIVHYSLHKRP